MIKFTLVFDLIHFSLIFCFAEIILKSPLNKSHLGLIIVSSNFLFICFIRSCGLTLLIVFYSTVFHKLLNKNIGNKSLLGLGIISSGRILCNLSRNEFLSIICLNMNFCHSLYIFHEIKVIFKVLTLIIVGFNFSFKLFVPVDHFHDPDAHLGMHINIIRDFLHTSGCCSNISDT